MTFKIKHEKKLVMIIGLISVLLFFVLGFFADKIPLWILKTDIAIAVVSFILYFIGQAVGTFIVIENNIVTIKYLFGRKRISVEKIRNVDIESYHRHRRGNSNYTEYRMRMTITLSDGKEIVLSDKATKSGFTFGVPEKLPDSEVPLYMAYTVIRSLI